MKATATLSKIWGQITVLPIYKLMATIAVLYAMVTIMLKRGQKLPGYFALFARSDYTKPAQRMQITV